MPYHWTAVSKSQTATAIRNTHTQTSPIPFVNCKQKAGWKMTHQKLFWYAAVLIDSFIIYCVMPQPAMSSLQFSVWRALTNEKPVSKINTDTFFKIAAKLRMFLLLYIHLLVIVSLVHKTFPLCYTSWQLEQHRHMLYWAASVERGRTLWNLFTGVMCSNTNTFIYSVHF